MHTQVPLRCRCGEVRGTAIEVSPQSGNRLVCYCDDCQAFARFLGRDDVLDAAGGTDIFQMAPARLQIARGADWVRCVRLSPQGMYRWYTECCRTPIGNTMGARAPFVGVIDAFMNHAGDGRSRDDVLGAPVGRGFGRDAIGGVPADTHPGVPVRATLRSLRLLAQWWLTGKGAPSPFFDRDTRRPRVEPRVLSPAERDALRPAPSAR